MSPDSGPEALDSAYPNGASVEVDPERLENDVCNIQETFDPAEDPENYWLQGFRNELSLDPLKEFAADSSIFRVPFSIKKISPDHFRVHDTHLGLQNRDLRLSGPPEICKLWIAQMINLELKERGKTWDTFVEEVVPDPATIEFLYEDPNKSLKPVEIQDLLTLDALFLVVFFQYRGNRCATSKLSTLMASDNYQRQLPSSLQHDLVLVENQIPMDVLVNVATQLCRMEEKDDEREAMDLMLKEAIFFLYPFMHGEKEEFMAFLNSYYSLECRNLQNCDHILDCVYRVVCHYHIPFPKYVKPTRKVEFMKRVLSATSLKRRGICIEGTACTMTDICFGSSRFGTSAKLKLPQIKIFDHTVALLRNLAVYEQIANNHRCLFRSYLHCMSHLIDTGDDVRLLSECGVINNFVGNNESVAASWSNICDGIIVGDPDDKWFTMYLQIHQYWSKRGKPFFGGLWCLC